MERIFEKVKDNMVCVYKDKNHTEKFFLGYIIGFDDVFLLLQCINKDGTVDGIGLIRVEDIYLIEADNQYIADVQKKSLQKMNISINDTGNVLESYLQYLIEEKKMVNIETNGSEAVDLHGIVTDIIDGWVELESYEKGISDGTSYCRLENITMIDSE